MALSYRIIVEKGVPLPKLRKRSGFIDVCSMMEVGDSFTHPYQRTVTDVNRKLTPKRFYCGKYGDSYRVWRVE